MILLTRSLLLVAIVAGAVWVAAKFTPHATNENVFQQLYLHLQPAALVKDPSAGHEEHAVAEAGEHAVETGEHDVEGGASEHAESPYLLEIPLPGLLHFFTLDSAGHPTGVLRLYNLQIFQIAAALLCLAAFAGVAGQIRSGKGDRLGKVFAGWAMWIRDEMVYPVMGKDLGRRFLPYFLVLFFFLVFMNLVGLIPGTATATASIFVTGAMAVTTLVAMIVGGMIAQGPLTFWKTLVPHVPLALWPLMFVVEVIGLMVKPFALMVRLFANMSGGHMVVLSFTGLIFFFAQSMGDGIGYASSPVAVAFAVFIMIIEAFVALLQAYIFTQLSIIFIGAAIHPEH